MTQPKFKIKKGDMVQVMTGKASGKRGVVSKVFLGDRKVLIQDVNVVVRNVKPDYKHPEGSYKKEMPIDISNVSLIDPKTNVPTKVGYKVDDNGNKVRYSRKSGEVI